MINIIIYNLLFSIHKHKGFYKFCGSFNCRFAFQYNPSLQPRALVVFGCISKRVSHGQIKQIIRILSKVPVPPSLLPNIYGSQVVKHIFHFSKRHLNLRSIKYMLLIKPLKCILIIYCNYLKSSLKKLSLFVNSDYFDKEDVFKIKYVASFAKQVHLVFYQFSKYLIIW